VNVVADATEQHGPGLGTFAYDDEGVQAQCTPIITKGLFTGYISSRETAHSIGEQVVALHKADRCPEGRMTLVLDSSQLGLQIHESIGHPIELDRVLGMESNFAGTSFLT